MVASADDNLFVSSPILYNIVNKLLSNMTMMAASNILSDMSLVT